MKKTVFYLLICLLFCASCKEEDQNEEFHNETCSSAKDVIIQRTPETDVFGIEAIQFSNNCISLDVVYGGGCNEHNFVLYANENVDSSSEFPTRKVSLHHDGNEDQCQAQLNETLIYDLSLIQLENFDKIYLLVEGVDDTLIYQY